MKTDKYFQMKYITPVESTMNIALLMCVLLDF